MGLTSRHYSLFLLLLVVLFGGCGRKDAHSGHGKNIMENAELIALYDRTGYDEVFIVAPNGDDVAHYILIDRNDSTPYEFPDGSEIIRVPVENAIVDSEVYASAMQELGVDTYIAGMLDPSYVTSPWLKSRLRKGKIKDVGQSLTPNTEKIIALSPDGILLSYYDGMQTQGIDKLGIPVIKMYDLQESTPLGRAEWMRFIGRLVGKEAESDSIFESVKDNYLELTKKQTLTFQKPKVLTEIIYNGTWSVAGGKSYHASLIRDSGGDYFKAKDKSAVTLNLQPEQVLADGGDADVWIIRFFGGGEQLRTLLSTDPLYGQIKAYKDGNIYYSDTSTSGMFREFPFHPDLLLKDYQLIFTNDTTNHLRYFKRLER